MPSRLILKKKDPMFPKQNRGPGYYYHRGNGIWSKYSAKRDAKIKARGYPVHKIGLPKGTAGRHLIDGKIGNMFGMVRKK